MNPPMNESPLRTMQPQPTPEDLELMRASAHAAILGMILAGHTLILDLVLPMAQEDFGADPGKLAQLGGAICAGVWIQTHQPYDHARDKTKMADDLRPMVLGGPAYPDALLWDRMCRWFREQAAAVAARRNGPGLTTAEPEAEGERDH